MERKILASRLKNRIEIWGNSKVKTDLGITYEETLIKKIWADIYPVSGSGAQEAGNTESNSVKFKIIIRKTDINHDDYIIFRGKRFSIDHIMPDFNNNKFIEIRSTLKNE